MEQEGEELLDLVERIRRADDRAATIGQPRGPASPGGGAGRHRPAAGRGAHPRLRALLPAHQPRRGEAARAAAAVGGPASRPMASSTAPSRTRWSALRRAGVPLGRARASLERCPSAWCSRRIPPRRVGGPCSSRSGAAIGCSTQLDDPRLTPDRGRGDPPPTAGGDHPPVAHLAAARPGAHAARRGAERDGVLRRVAVRGHAAPRTGRSTGRSTGRRPTRPVAAARDTGMTGTRPPRMSAVPGVGLVGRRRPRRQPERDRGHHPARRCASRPTTCCAATRRCVHRLSQTIAAIGPSAGLPAPASGRSWRATTRELPRDGRGRPAPLPGGALPAAAWCSSRSGCAGRVGTSWTGAPERGRLRSHRRAASAALDELRDALAGAGPRRGSPTATLLDLRWQVETFGFHALGLEVRQHSEVHARALELLPRRASRCAGPTASMQRRAAELLAQERRRACRWARCWARSGPSATSRPRSARMPAIATSSASRASAQDVLDVLDLAAVAGGPPVARTWCPCSSPRTRSRTAGAIVDRAARGPRLPGAPGVARRWPGGDARLLRLDQGVRARWRPPGCSTGPRSSWPTVARAARRPADALPRSRRRHRSGRRTHEPGHPRRRARVAAAAASS